MKIRTAKYIIKEGISNTYRNKLMSLASLCIVTASLIILGIFLLLSININRNIKSLSDQPEIQAFCDKNLDNEQVKKVENSIKENDKIQKYKLITKKEAFADLKKSLFNGNSELLEGIDDSIVGVSFIITLKNPEDSTLVSQELKKVIGITNVVYSKQVIDFISRISQWIRVISGFLLVVLLVISMFIISNTIKLTVFARRKEINIMKYIGATDWFIRWPFVIEGAIIGLIGAAISFILVSYGYNALVNWIINDLNEIGLNVLKFVSLNEVAFRIIMAYSIIGVAIGTLGSIISIRKYLRV